MGRVDRLRCIRVVPKCRSRLATGTPRGLVSTPDRLRPMAGNCHGDPVTNSTPLTMRLTISFVTDHILGATPEASSPPVSRRHPPNGYPFSVPFTCLLAGFLGLSTSSTTSKRHRCHQVDRPGRPGAALKLVHGQSRVCSASFVSASQNVLCKREKYEGIGEPKVWQCG